MIEIKHIILCALFILGLNGLFESGNIFHILVVRIKKLPVVIQKPLYRCAFCMSSVWGTIWYWSMKLLEDKWTLYWDEGFTTTMGTFLLWPLFCILVAGTVRLFMLIGNYDVTSIE